MKSKLLLKLFVHVDLVSNRTFYFLCVVCEDGRDDMSSDSLGLAAREEDSSDEDADLLTDEQLSEPWMVTCSHSPMCGLLLGGEMLDWRGVV